MMKKIRHLSNKIIYILIAVVLVAMTLVSCKPYRKSQVLIEYDGTRSLYWTKDVYVEYDYNDYIYDDVSNDEYILSSPSMSDFKDANGNVDFNSYLPAKLDYGLKEKLLSQYHDRAMEMAMKMHKEKYKEKNSIIYYYNALDKTNTQLTEDYATNISYDDEKPMIMFSVDDPENVVRPEVGMRIKLSDVMLTNSSIDGYMKVILNKGKKQRSFVGAMEVTND